MSKKVLLSGPSPRIVAHRGFSSACPENTLPAFGAAFALGADELELDVWPSADGELVILHDPKLDRTTDKTGIVKEIEWADIATADAGIWRGEQWRGVRVPRLNDVWDVFAGKIPFNIHIKDAGEDGAVVRKIVQLAQKYNITEQVYIACSHTIMDVVKEHAPNLAICCLSGGLDWGLVDYAAEHQCERVQFRGKFCNREYVQKAHDAGIICNLYYADDPQEAAQYYDWGIDALLTNALAEILPVRQAARNK